MWVCHHCLEISEDDSWEECWSCGGARDRNAGVPDEFLSRIREIEALRALLSRCPRCEGEMKFRAHREIPHDLHGRDNVDYDTEKVVVYYCTRCGKLETFLAEVGAHLRGDPERFS